MSKTLKIFDVFYPSLKKGRFSVPYPLLKKGRFSAPVVLSNKFGSPNPFVHFSVYNSSPGSSPTKFILGNKKKETINNFSAFFKTWRKIIIIMGMLFMFFVFIELLLTISWLTDVNFINSFMEIFNNLSFLLNHCIKIANGYQFLLNFTFYILCSLIILFVWSSKAFNIKTLIYNSFIFRIFVSAISLIFMFIGMSATLFYALLYTLIVYSFVISDKKVEFIYKLLFILSFWYLFYGAIIIICNIDIAVVLSIFIINYEIDGFNLYSDIDPYEYKALFDNLHQLLKNLNINYNIPGGKPEKNSDIFISDNDDHKDEKKISLSKYKDLFIPIKYNDKDVYIILEPDKDEEIKHVFKNENFKNIMKQMHKHNKNLRHIEKQDLMGEAGKVNLAKLNETLANNEYIDNPFFNTEFFVGWFKNFHLKFFAGLKPLMDDYIAKYNALSAAKYYYENNEIGVYKKGWKELISSKHNIGHENTPIVFKKMWDTFHVSQVKFNFEHYNKFIIEQASKHKFWSLFKKYPNFIEPDSPWHDMSKKHLIYKELIDNQLIVGSGILSMAYIYDNMYKDYTHIDDFLLSTWDLSFKQEIYSRAWYYYEQSISKYHVFYDCYNWHMKINIIRDYPKGWALDMRNFPANYPSIKDRNIGFAKLETIHDEIMYQLFGMCKYNIHKKSTIDLEKIFPKNIFYEKCMPSTIKSYSNELKKPIPVFEDSID